MLDYYKPFDFTSCFLNFIARNWIGFVGFIAGYWF